MSKYIAILLLTLVVCPCKAQTDNDLSGILVQTAFHNFQQDEVVKPTFFSLDQKTFFQKLNPIIYISGSLLFIYQKVISEQIQAQCTYKNSCSNNMKNRLVKEGFKGFFMGIDQLSSCFPAVVRDYPKHKITDNYRVDNDL